MTAKIKLFSNSKLKILNDLTYKSLPQASYTIKTVEGNCCVSKSHSSPVEGSREPLLYVWLWHRGGQNLTETPLSKMLNRYDNILYMRYNVV